VQEIDDAGELMLGADRELDRDATVRELLAQRAERAEEVRALAVEHVHEDDARQAELLRARPHTRGVHLDAHHRGRNDERAFDDAQARDRVRLEPGVAGCVDQVDLAALPLEMRERRGQRHLPSLLVLVPVADRRSRLDRAEPVDRARLEEHRLEKRRLTRPAVADDGDVADLPGLLHQLLLGRFLGPRAILVRVICLARQRPVDAVFGDVSGRRRRRTCRLAPARPGTARLRRAYARAAAPARRAFKRRIAFV
jgi:hypothetical protein